MVNQIKLDLSGVLVSINHGQPNKTDLSDVLVNINHGQPD